MTVITQSQRKTVGIGQTHILVNNIKEFAVLQRQPNENGFFGITLSIPLTGKDADYINNSGIVTVHRFTQDGTMVFTRKDFYDPYVMVELILELLIKYEAKTEATQQPA